MGIGALVELNKFIVFLDNDRVPAHMKKPYNSIGHSMALVESHTT